MRNFKLLALPILVFLLAGCQEESHFFVSIKEQENRINYSDVHTMNLNVTALNKFVDETGFAPILKCELLLENLKHGPWPQAWVAFDIHIYVKGEKLSTITRAGALENHQLMVVFDQNMPKFGLAESEIAINIEPIAWMPTYPLEIDSNERSYSSQTFPSGNDAAASLKTKPGQQQGS